ncbi:MAG TPA: glycosyltransferase family 1 protein [Solirubrobacteraceae bacterium]|jgi:glycosyltransferase involved in cell wall biosynthesis|nr:glycosyltransferase family 1 protein [Solirubrobacteraceae bacterium]
MSADLPRRIGLNAVFLEGQMGGLETYVRAIVPELVRLAPAARFSLFCSARGRQRLAREEWSGEVELVTHPLLGLPGLKAVSELTLLGAIAARRVDLLHSVAFTAPLRTRAVNVVMLPDVIWVIAPDEDHPATMRLWRTVVPRVARRADRLIAISHAAAREIVEHLHVDPQRIDVIPLGPGTQARGAPTPALELRRRLELGAGPIVLAVSAKKVHKNLARLIEALPAVLARHPAAMLVLPGRPTPHEQELRSLAAQLGVGAHVAFPDYVAEADLEGLYAAASCFAMPSLNEGFGLPLLEAMRHGVPVACSNVSAMPEVAGEAARYFDPRSAPEIAAALIALLDDEPLRRRLADAGRRRAAGFTWEATAQRTLESYERAWHAARG